MHSWPERKIHIYQHGSELTGFTLRIHSEELLDRISGTHRKCFEIRTTCSKDHTACKDCLTSLAALHCYTHLVEGLSIVDTNDRPNHLRDNDHIPQVRPHRLWLLAAGCFPLGLPQLLDQG